MTPCPSHVYRLCIWIKLGKEVDQILQNEVYVIVKMTKPTGTKRMDN